MKRRDLSFKHAHIMRHETRHLTQKLDGGRIEHYSATGTPHTIDHLRIISTDDYGVSWIVQVREYRSNAPQRYEVICKPGMPGHRDYAAYPAAYAHDLNAMQVAWLCDKITSGMQLPAATVCEYVVKADALARGWKHPDSDKKEWGSFPPTHQIGLYFVFEDRWGNTFAI